MPSKGDFSPLSIRCPSARPRPVADVWYERGLAFDAAWRPVRYDDPRRRFRLILDMMFITDDGGEDYSGRVAVVRDYKSSWATDESEISTFQMKAQAVAAFIVLPDLDGVRREAVNLRTGQIFGETLWLEQGGREQLAEWRDEITAYMDALDKMQDANGQRPTRPGVGCLSCAWVMHCDFAAPMADSAMALAQLLAQNEGRRAQLIKMLKGAASDKPIEFDTTSVGYHVKPKHEPKPDATRLAWEEWQKHDGDIDGFIAALRPSLAGSRTSPNC